MSKRKEQTNVLKLNLMDAPRTWFHWNGSDHNVSEAPANVFDAWIREYVEDIENVDVASWEIFHRWGIINTVIKGRLLVLSQREDGSQLLEDFSSEVESELEEKSSDQINDETASQAV